mmetsp:Transcript_20372/g.36432  ORF Transcript_20372/g.36432 Transcript_20372/m.36432 type:complete len:608 (+) Transcript_20372:63-1886(+)|eukprot:CAMPEP_0197662904 /NCGR_PEP_ID=MMETSP1338-20131121/55301_1 /TAXON_ID=43686 ORGANISM="Pelagodinium beii, Strain RCC1491" /NCGR_SAMPLE_ID=MMETSP1338 /ASSEMBLY_ACC=CAM_ASM_000754 /LENGTH=607 /DNA_ID=CAMNT_0043240995 /DNA_START=65 /DNA_END=1888 /DNA_ORIENTATION=-
MTEMFASMQDSDALAGLTERQAFVTEEIKEEMEDSVVPPSQRAFVLRYIKAVSFGMYVTGACLFLIGLLAPHFGYLDGVQHLLIVEPFVLLVLSGILLSFGFVQTFRSIKTTKPHYLLSGVLFFLLGAGLILFSVTDLNWTSKYYIACVGIAMYTLQYCLEWEFDIMMAKFLRQIRSEKGEYRLKARMGDEVLTQPIMGSVLNFMELKWIFGCNTHKSREALDEEQEINEFWGNFRLRDRPDMVNSTEDQLIAAYRYASNTTDLGPAIRQEDPRLTESYEPGDGFSRFMNFMEGLTTQLSWITSLAFAGLETGKLVFGESSVSETPRIIAVVLSCLSVAAFLCNIYQAQSMMTTALGLPVAEREWIAIDVMDKNTDKRDLRKSVMDEQEQRRLNLTYFWLCAAAVADSWGAGIICKLCSNCALMTKCMIEEGTAFEFIGFAKARFQLMIWGNVINIIQVFFLAMMSVMWFGSYGIKNTSDLFWAGYVLLICFLAAGLRIRESAKLWHAMEAQASWVNQLFGVMVVAFACVMLVLITCLIPIILGNGNLFGSCDKSVLYEELFPHLCSHSQSENAAAYWVIVGSISVGIGLTIGAFLFGSPTVVFINR